MNARTRMLIGLTAGMCLIGAAGAFASLDEPEAPKDDEAPKVAEIGKKAPDFELKDLEGNTHKLSDHRGKIVILEWFNPECPFVVHIHQDDHSYKEWSNKLHEDDEYVIFAINSGAPGQQGTGIEKNRGYQERWSIKYPILVDEEGTVGRAYEARRTPQMYLIDKEGILRYNGAIDNAPMGRATGEDGERISYIKRAVAQLKAGETISPERTREYGCTVKYVEGTPGERPGRGARGEDGQRGERGAPGRGRGEGGRGGRGGGEGGGRGGRGGGGN